HSLAARSDYLQIGFTAAGSFPFGRYLIRGWPACHPITLLRNLDGTVFGTPPTASDGECSCEEKTARRAARTRGQIEGLVHGQLPSRIVRHEAEVVKIGELATLLHRTTASGRVTRRASSDPACFLQETGWPRHPARPRRSS